MKIEFSEKDIFAIKKWIDWANYRASWNQQYLYPFLKLIVIISLAILIVVGLMFVPYGKWIVVFLFGVCVFFAVSYLLVFIPNLKTTYYPVIDRLVSKSTAVDQLIECMRKQKLNGNNKDLFYQIVLIYEAISEYGTAEKLLEKLCEIDDNNIVYKVHLAASYIANGKKESCIKLVNELGENTVKLGYDEKRLYGYVKLCLEQYEEAKSIFSELIKENPNDFYVERYLASIKCKIVNEYVSPF